MELVLELWPSISQELQDSELYIASYNNFPISDYDSKLHQPKRKMRQFSKWFIWC
jgi:hypothetical protein